MEQGRKYYIPDRNIQWHISVIIIKLHNKEKKRKEKCIIKVNVFEKCPCNNI